MPIDGRTRLAFLLGHPVAHSLSPPMHQAAFAAAGLNAAYLPWAVPPARLAEAVAGLRSLENLLGANLTVPHKETVLPLADALSAEAEAMGAANTLWRDGERLVADNTDGAGFLAALDEAWPGRDPTAPAVLVGAGGAARAVAVALARAGARRLTQANRTPERARELAGFLGARFPACGLEVAPLRPDWRLAEPLQAALLVNTSAGGLHPGDPPLFDYDSLHPPLRVCDLIYNPPETALLLAARERGCPTLNGLGMLLHQGALAFERWTALPAPREAMRAALWAAAGDIFLDKQPPGSNMIRG
jgi:shikimate dehydrogenase